MSRALTFKTDVPAPPWRQKDLPNDLGIGTGVQGDEGLPDRRSEMGSERTAWRDGEGSMLEEAGGSSSPVRGR